MDTMMILRKIFKIKYKEFFHTKNGTFVK